MNFNDFTTVNKIVKALQKGNLKSEFYKIIAKINDGSGDFSDCNLDFFLTHSLIHWHTKSPLRGQDRYFLTALGEKVKNQLL